MIYLAALNANRAARGHMVKEVPHDQAVAWSPGEEVYVAGRTHRSQKEKRQVLLQKHNSGKDGDILIEYHNMLELLSGKADQKLEVGKI